MAPTQQPTTSSKDENKKKKKVRKDNAKKTMMSSKSEEMDTGWSNMDDLMSPEDMELLKGIDEGSEDEIEFDSDGGKDIDPSEIADFIKTLGVAKHRPDSIGVETDTETEELEDEDNKNLKTKEKVNDADQIKKNKNKEQQNQKNKIEESSKTVQKENRQNIPEIKKENVTNHNIPKNDPASSASAIQYLKNYKSRKFLLLKPGEMWREERVSQSVNAPDLTVLEEAEKLARKLLQDEISLYNKQRESNKRSESSWLKTVLSGGTLTDKMAALTLLVQDSPLHNLHCLETLLTMAAKKGRRECLMAVDTLRDMFLTGLLPDDRKLLNFNQRPLGELKDLTKQNVDLRDKLLLMWHFEAMLKKKYAEFVKRLGEMSFDTLLATKEKSVSVITKLLTSKPEQETMLLPMLVNKLGDHTIKSKVMYLLSKLIEDHPNMTEVVVREVKQLLHRANVSPQAQYYGICFLAQVRLSAKRSGLASDLINIYFFFFQTFLGKGEVDNKMMSALLTGVNRAYVYSKQGNGLDKSMDSNKTVDLSQQMDAVYRLIPKVGFHTGVQALQLLYQVTDSDTVSDRYYNSLYRKLADPSLKNSSKQAIFMNLIYKSLKRDVVDRRIKAFIKRILQVYAQQPPEVICGMLFLLSEVLKEKPGLRSSLTDLKRAISSVWENDEEEEKFVDLPDPDDEQEFKSGEEGTVNVSLDASMMSKMEDNVGKGITKKCKRSKLINDKEDEITQGLNSVEESNAEKKDNKKCNGWLHRMNIKRGQSDNKSYNPLSRNPLYAQVDSDCVWELQQLTRHYHPSVQLYASQILQGENIEYEGDPLRDFTLIRFLDRFVFRNPKKDLGKVHKRDAHVRPAPAKVRSGQVNTEDFLNLKESDVPEEDKFFYRYFTERAKRVNNDDDASDGSVSDTEFDDYLENYERDADADGFADLDLDFFTDKKKKGKSDNDEKELEESDEFDDEEDDDDSDMDFGDDELAAQFQTEMETLGKGGGDDIDSDFDMPQYDDDDGVVETQFSGQEFSSDDEDDDLQKLMKKPTNKKRKKENNLDASASSKKKKKATTDSLFASAEEFGHLLEEETEFGGVSLGGGGDVKNTDKSNRKQLAWEASRERVWQGRDKGRNTDDKRGNKQGSKGKSKQNRKQIFKKTGKPGFKPGGKSISKKSGGKKR